MLRPLARSSKLCGAPSQPTRPSISASMPSGTVPTHAAVCGEVVGGVGERPDQRALLCAHRVRRELQLRRAHADQARSGSPGPKRRRRRPRSGSPRPRRSPSWPDRPVWRRPPQPSPPAVGSITCPPSLAHRSRRDALTSDTARLVTPSRRAASRHACPIGPPPMTSTRSSAVALATTYGVIAHGERLHQCPELGRHALRQDHHVLRRGGDPVGERRRNLRGHAKHHATAAPLLLTIATGRAGSAGHHRVDGDQLAGREVGHARAELVDPADRLVAHHLAGMAAPVLPGVAVEVRAADAGGDDLDDHLARFRLRLGPFLHRDVVCTTQHQCLHMTTSYPVVALLVDEVSATRPRARRPRPGGRPRSRWPS